MLRMNGFVEKTRDWKLEPIDFSDPENVQKSWREWVRHESAKRYVSQSQSYERGVPERSDI